MYDVFLLLPFSTSKTSLMFMVKLVIKNAFTIVIILFTTIIINNTELGMYNLPKVSKSTLMCCAKTCVMISLTYILCMNENQVA